MPEISVIIPAYNAAPFIGRTIESVLSQTHNNWKLIVVDDGSTDSTEDVIKRFSDVRIRYLRQINHGPAVARNLGLAESQGDYVIFLDADDWWDKRCLERLAGVLDQATDKDAVAHADWAYANNEGHTGNIVSSAMDKRDALSTLVLRNPIAIHSALVRRQALQAIGGFPREYPALEDWELWLRLAVADYGFLHVPELLAYYCWRPGSKGKDVEGRKKDRLATLDRLWSRQDLPRRVQSLEPASYATAHVDFCVSRLYQNQKALALKEFDTAIQHDSSVATKLDTYYRLANGDEELRPQDIEYFLAHLSEAQPDVNIRRARSAAYKALGQAYYHKRRFALSRHFWLRAAKQHPGSMLLSGFSLLFAKSLLHSLIGQGRP
ncbi:MAG: glycosyltransferase [Anaerolineae bacterium]